MQYIKVKWIHSHPDEPVLLYSELDEDRWETRKVEIFPDGTTGFAGPDEQAGSSILAEVPMPTLEEIASDPQFVPQPVQRHEFEQVWARRHQRPHGRKRN